MSTNISRRTFLKMAGVAGGAAVLGGCVPPSTVAVPQAGAPAAPAAPKGETNVTAYSYWFTLNRNLFELVDQFNRANPDVPPVRIGRLPAEVESGGLNERFLLEAKNKKSTWVAWCGSTPFIDFVSLPKGDVCLPMEDKIPADIKADIIQTHIDESTVNGHMWHWPMFASATGLNYRPSMLKQAGWDKPPKDWKEFIQCCKDVEAKVKAPDGSKVYGTVFDPFMWRFFTPVGYSLVGTDLFRKEDGYVNWDHPAMPEILEQMKEIAQYAPPDVYVPFGDVDAFKTGKSAMMIKFVDAGLTAAKVFGMGDYEFAFLPEGGPGRENSTVAWGTGIMFFKYGENTDTALKLVEYFARSELFQQGWVEGGEPIVYKSWYDKLKDPPKWLAVNRDMITKAHFIPPSEHYFVMADHWKAAQDSYLKGEIATPKEMLAQARKNFEDALKKIS